MCLYKKKEIEEKSIEVENVIGCILLIPSFFKAFEISRGLRPGGGGGDGWEGDLKKTKQGSDFCVLKL